MPPRSVNFDRIADRYDDTRGGGERGRYYADLLEPRFARRGLTLEVGVGTGLVAAALVAAGRRVIGIDISRLMLARARARLGGRVAVADVMRLPLAEGSVADAYCVWVLHLVADAPAAMAEVRRVLRPGGRFLVGTPGNWGDDPVLEIVRDMHVALGHDGSGQLDELAGQARSAGLAVLEVAHGAEHTRETTIAEEIARIESRTGSALWDLPDSTWAEVVEPALARLRSMPDPGKPILATVAAPILVLERV